MSLKFDVREHFVREPEPASGRRDIISQSSTAGFDTMPSPGASGVFIFSLLSTSPSPQLTYVCVYIWCRESHLRQARLVFPFFVHMLLYVILLPCQSKVVKWAGVVNYNIAVFPVVGRDVWSDIVPGTCFTYCCLDPPCRLICQKPREVRSLQNIKDPIAQVGDDSHQ